MAEAGVQAICKFSDSPPEASGENEGDRSKGATLIIRRPQDGVLDQSFRHSLQTVTSIVPLTSPEIVTLSSQEKRCCSSVLSMAVTLSLSLQRETSMVLLTSPEILTLCLKENARASAKALL